MNKTIITIFLAVVAKETYEITDDYIIKSIISLLHILECSRCIDINYHNSIYYELEYMTFDAISYFVKNHIHIDNITDPLKLEFINKIKQININHTIHSDLLSTFFSDLNSINRYKSKNISNELLECIQNYISVVIVGYNSLEG